MSKKVITGFTDVPANELFLPSEIDAVTRFEFDADAFPTREEFDTYYHDIGCLNIRSFLVTITIEVEE